MVSDPKPACPPSGTNLPIYSASRQGMPIFYRSKSHLASEHSRIIEISGPGDEWPFSAVFGGTAFVRQDG